MASRPFTASAAWTRCQHLRALNVDGIAGPKTIAGIEEFQRRVVRMIHPDGRVDRAGRSIMALSNASSETPSSPSAGLPAAGGGASLTAEDFNHAAEAIGCEVACLKTVTDYASRRR